MLSKEEKRFIRYWEDQRRGGKLSYLLLYSLIGTFIMSLFVLVGLLLLLQYYFSWALLIAVVSSCFVVTVIISFYAWQTSEKKWKRIIHREVDRARLAEGHE